MRRAFRLALALAAALVAVANANVVFTPPSASDASHALKVALESDVRGVERLVYTINSGAPTLRSNDADTKTYDGEKITLAVGTWTIKAAEVQDGVLGKVFEAQYDVRPNTDGGAGMSATTVLGVILLLVMIFFGVVVVASVCTAGFSAFFKSAPVIRGPGADGERRTMKRSLSVSAMELGQIASGGFRNNPAQGDDENDTATLLANAASELAAGRSGKRD